MSEKQPFMQLATMSRWYVVSRGIHTVAKLGLANFMSFEPKPIKQLAEATDTKPELLDRLMNFLTAYDIFHKVDQSYALTELSTALRDDDPSSIRAVLCMVDDSWWQAFSNMDIMLKTGKSAFSNQHQEDFFNFLAKHPEKQKHFDQGMAKLSTYDDDKIAKAFDYSKYSTLIDMGGGRGGLSKALAARYPNLQITLFDTAAVIDNLDDVNFPKQITLAKGDFLKKIPQADAYLFKGVLHDFSDVLMREILTNCRKQMPQHAELLVAEQVLPTSLEPHPNKTMDIVMMVLLAGRQRNLAEWKTFIENCGFHFQDSYDTESIFTLMRARG